MRSATIFTTIALSAAVVASSGCDNAPAEYDEPGEADPESAYSTAGGPSDLAGVSASVRPIHSNTPLTVQSIQAMQKSTPGKRERVGGESGLFHVSGNVFPGMNGTAQLSGVAVTAPGDLISGQDKTSLYDMSQAAFEVADYGGITGVLSCTYPNGSGEDFQLGQASQIGLYDLAYDAHYVSSAFPDPIVGSAGKEATTNAGDESTAVVSDWVVDPKALIAKFRKNGFEVKRLTDNRIEISGAAGFRAGTHGLAEKRDDRNRQSELVTKSVLNLESLKVERSTLYLAGDKISEQVTMPEPTGRRDRHHVKLYGSTSGDHLLVSFGQ